LAGMNRHGLSLAPIFSIRAFPTASLLCSLQKTLLFLFLEKFFFSKNRIETRLNHLSEYVFAIPLLRYKRDDERQIPSKICTVSALILSEFRKELALRIVCRVC